MAPIRADIFDRSPTLRGKLERQADLRRYTWFRTGGPADVLFQPADRDDLQNFMRALRADVPVTVIGVGSNLLVRDGGIEGAVVRLPKAFAVVDVDGTRLTCGAGATDIAVAKAAQRNGVAGLEFLRGVPGTIGGAVVMNAGAYGAELSDVLVSVDVMDRKGQITTIPAEQIAFGYRHSGLSPDLIVLGATLQGMPGDPSVIEQRMADITAAREETQPVRTQTGGSTFKNPEGHKAWQLVDEAGCRGLTIGQAQVSPKHTNFLINLGGASATEIEALGEEVRRRVFAHSGIELEWEIRRIGRADNGLRGETS